MDDEELEPDPEEVELFGKKISELEEVARKVGIYLDRAVVTDISTESGVKRGVVAEFTVGRVAFTDRVQNPEQEQIDKQFQQMTHGLGTDEFLAVRERMKKNIAEGRDPMDNGGLEQ